MARCTASAPASLPERPESQPQSSAAASSPRTSCTTACSNRQARRRYGSSPPQLDTTQRTVLERLREDGYAVLPFAELVTDPEAWKELEADGGQFISETEAALAAEADGGQSACAGARGRSSSSASTPTASSWGSTIPWLRLGINRRLLDVANAYLGMWSKLEYVDLWYTPSAEGERKSSQRWHRDFNDRHLLKAFLYLVDVDDEAGPSNTSRAAPRG